ncbi:hypothetical protein EC973_003848 [Apophysomyces ossiformis]|uniref:C2H2-type domain-containing protein n=1 Tax=Apophysomyces ossiformis TaxID=679940 RepID=A0A8H7BSX0_9FUNG|nr:hypothetical protein EC973_003848 [Apophysomyces ossiformis]
MPVPIEYTSFRRMSTITVPKQDIQFDSYDFQLCQPQTDVKDTFESSELEATFCRDFACCGLILNDLHDLLQHYEECHVRLEDDDGSLYDDDSAGPWSPTSLSFSSDSPTTAPSSPTLTDDPLSSSTTTSGSDIHTLKKKAAAYLSDLYNTTGTASPATLTVPVSTSCGFNDHNGDIHGGLVDEDAAAAAGAAASTTKKSSGKKRSYAQISSNTTNALDLLTQSAVKKLALVANGDVPTPSGILTDGDFLAQAGALLATANMNIHADKPYKCPVPGCDKAYKNPNGLKYHNQHGHCNLVSDENENVASKPYQCTIGDCGKRYKNLNGLKYHIEHSHMAVLNHTLAAFGSSLFSGSSSSNLQTSEPSSPVDSPGLSDTLLSSLF